MLLHIGLDDTDSPGGGCTTYIAAILVEKLTKLGVDFIDYPNLIRLNPNIPWKTRGNGAICLRVEAPETIKDEIKKIVIETVEVFSDYECENTNPGIVFYVGGDVPEPLKKFASRAVQGLVSLEEALILINDVDGTAIGYKNMRGIMGAIAAIGNCLEEDHTYEFIAYRKPTHKRKKRAVDAKSVYEMDDLMKGETFNNIDRKKNRILITPHGLDPVLFGVRGESVESVRKAGSMVRVGEEIERWVIFRTNQGTDAHLQKMIKISDAKVYHPAVIDVEVASKPKVIEGGHVIFQTRDETGHIYCAAYEPTGDFREIIRDLIEGDFLRVYGGVKSAQGTINLEKIEILKLAKIVRMENPRCPGCGRKMESMGRGKGFRCRKCGFRDSSISKIKVESPRNLVLGVYLPTPSAQRHLTKPIGRYGKEKNGYTTRMLEEPWHCP